MSTGPEMFFVPQPKASKFELKSLTNMTLSERLLMVSKSLRFAKCVKVKEKFSPEGRW